MNHNKEEKRGLPKFQITKNFLKANDTSELESSLFFDKKEINFSDNDSITELDKKKKIKSFKNRINSRKCRERKKEYLQSLEKQLQNLKNSLYDSIQQNNDSLLSILKCTLPNSLKLYEKDIFPQNMTLATDDNIKEFLSNLNQKISILIYHNNFDVDIKHINIPSVQGTNGSYLQNNINKSNVQELLYLYYRRLKKIVDNYVDLVQLKEVDDNNMSDNDF